jgi:hypothetical protein
VNNLLVKPVRDAIQRFNHSTGGVVLNITVTERATAFDLLRKSSTLGEISKFLANKGLPSSASSWPETFERLAGLINSSKLSRTDILSLLQDAEEYGRQHVFMSTCSKSVALGLINQNTLLNNLAALNNTEIFSKPLIVAKPKGLQLTEARIDVPKTGGLGSLIIKAVDVHSYRERTDKQINGDIEIETYEWRHDRVVDLISVRADGLMEVRIQSRKNVADYVTLANNLIAKATGLLDPLKFAPFSLAKARISLIEKRYTLSHIVELADNQLRDSEGRIITVATGHRQQELYPKGSASDKAVQGFMSVGKPKCDEVDCFWIPRKGTPVPTQDLHTLISGADNEFTLTTHCGRKDYEYALAQLLYFSK